MQIRTLIGHKEMATGVICLKSLLECSRDSLSLIVHDDGTLTRDDKDILNQFAALIISRKEADEVIEQRLKEFPYCLAYRRKHPHGLKLFDVTLISDEFLAYVDSDIFFQCPFSGLFRPAKAIFMRDRRNAYSLRPWHALNIRVPDKVNTGLILLQTNLFDLDLIESLLSKPSLQAMFERRPYWVEQTMWAALGWRVGCQLLNSEQFQIAHPRMKTERAIGVHYVSTYRHMLAGRRSFNDLQMVKTEPMINVSLFGLLLSDAQGRLSRL